MTLLLLLLVPFCAALIVLTCKEPERAVRVAIAAGTLQMVAIANAVWRIRSAGVVQFGRYLRADGLTGWNAPAQSTFHIENCRRYSRLRFAIDALGLIAAVIDALHDARFAQRLVQHLPPSLAHPQELVPGGRKAARVPIRSIQLQCRSGTETAGAYLTGRHQHMRVVMPLIRLRPRPVDREVHRIPIPIRELLREPPHQLNPLGRRKFRRHQHQNLARQPAVLSPARMLGRIPECGPLQRPLHIGLVGTAGRQHDLRMRDIRTVGVVINRARALITDELARPIRGSPGRLAALAARNDFDA